MTPDFSAGALSRAISHQLAMAEVAAGPAALNARRIEKRRLMKDAGLAEGDFQMALAGRLFSGLKRTRMFAALGLSPLSLDIYLTDDRDQHHCPDCGRGERRSRGRAA